MLASATRVRQWRVPARCRMGVGYDVVLGFEPSLWFGDCAQQIEIAASTCAKMKRRLYCSLAEPRRCTAARHRSNWTTKSSLRRSASVLASKGRRRLSFPP